MAFPRKFSSLQEVKNKCNTLTRKTKKRHFKYVAKIGFLQRERHSGIQSDLLLQIKVQYQMKT